MNAKLANVWWWSVWQGRRLAHAIKAMGVVAVGLGVFCVTAYFSALRPMRLELADVQARAAVEARLPAKSVQSVAQSPEDSLRGFLGKLPPVASTPDTLADIQRIAKESGLSIDQAELRLVRELGQSIVRYEMTFQLSETYPKIRGFVARLLASVPHVAVEHLAFQRQKVGDAKAETQVRLVAFFRE